MGRFCTEVHHAYVVAARPAYSKVVDVALIDVKGVVAEAALQVLIAFSGAAFGTGLHIVPARLAYQGVCAVQAEHIVLATPTQEVVISVGFP